MLALTFLLASLTSTGDGKRVHEPIGRNIADDALREGHGFRPLRSFDPREVLAMFVFAQHPAIGGQPRRTKHSVGRVAENVVMIRPNREQAMHIGGERLPSKATSRRAFATAIAAAALGTQTAFAEDTVVTKYGVTPGGVKYFDKVKGKGYSPQEGDFVVVQYVGYLPGGKIFDSPQAEGKKFQALKYKAKPRQMLPGWEEALEDMKEGGTRIIDIPPEMAFGAKGLCDDKGECVVPPNTKVQYELTLKRVAVTPNM
mmetsp:Transcript_52126/g.82759  ORF Transcript_52126/g.82759 Transcript_52126/m.82759 type:complete len:257 (-) Transcript_52126:47-817(-)|eukprot:CAMPEP_0169077086 /NCGR_PEP_ID=MMETSP1015-20121227/8691_1 /TAXON_ID=342587 /ORGANISM="Karlodinium micrum, Strain CCMP2283" /LENGTH=256 /DNA_ID=CAMNT_0009136587 /DNA_START=56 /DNA_END=826 /DNA_ORIENTATION=+